MLKRTIIAAGLALLSTQAFAAVQPFMVADSVRDSTIVWVTTADRDSARADLKRAIADPHRRIFLLDINYRKYGPVTSFRDERFRVWNTQVYMPLDSVAGLYEYTNYGALCAGIGIGAGFIIAITEAWLFRSTRLDQRIAPIAIPILTLGGLFVGSILEHTVSWPAGRIR